MQAGWIGRENGKLKLINQAIETIDTKTPQKICFFSEAWIWLNHHSPERQGQENKNKVVRAADILAYHGHQ